MMNELERLVESQAERLEAIEKRFDNIERHEVALAARMDMLEGNAGWRGLYQKIIELDIEWPEADIGGLHFDVHKTHDVFELKEDGNYYSRDILFSEPVTRTV
jgi:hypothetical protein